MVRKHMIDHRILWDSNYFEAVWFHGCCLAVTNPEHKLATLEGTEAETSTKVEEE